VIDKPRDVSSRAAVQIVASIEHENINAIITAAALPLEPLAFTATRLRLGDAFTRVLNHPRAIRNERSSIRSPSMNGRLRSHHPKGATGHWPLSARTLKTCHD
jgi:hypothetical protein